MKSYSLLVIIASLLLLNSIGYCIGERLWVATLPTPGCYGLTYNPTNNRIYYTNLNIRVIRIISSDSLVIQYDSLRVPSYDSAYVDIKYCAYDNTFWLLNHYRKQVYKINSSNGIVLYQFDISSMDYPMGLAWDDENRQIYLSDRRTNPGDQPYIYCLDTLGNVIRQMNAPMANYGLRCITYQPIISGVPAHLLAVYTFFDSGGSTPDSAGVFELNPADCAVINFFRIFPADTCNVRGIDVDPRNGNYWISLYTYGTGANCPSAIYKVVGFHSLDALEKGNNLPLGAMKIAILPNPTSITAAIIYRLESGTSVNAQIFDVSGRLVKILYDGRQNSGQKKLIWNSTDENGKRVNAGVYFVRLKACNTVLNANLVIMK